MRERFTKNKPAKLRRHASRVHLEKYTWDKYTVKTIQIFVFFLDFWKKINFLKTFRFLEKFLISGKIEIFGKLSESWRKILNFGKIHDFWKSG